MICERTWLPLAATTTTKKTTTLISFFIILSSSSTVYAKSWFSGSESFAQSNSINGLPQNIVSYSNQQHQGFIGCLFSESVCNNEEVCFDDYLFGQCVVPGEVDESSLERFDSLTDTERQVINFEAHKLDDLGYSWSDEYPQCVLENLIFAIKNRTPFDEELCYIFKGEKDSSEQISSFEDGDSDVVDERRPSSQFSPDNLEFNYIPSSIQQHQQQQLPGLYDDDDIDNNEIDDELRQLLFQQQQQQLGVENDVADDDNDFERSSFTSPDVSSSKSDVLLPISYVDVDGNINDNNNNVYYTTNNGNNDNINEDEILIPDSMMPAQPSFEDDVVIGPSYQRYLYDNAAAVAEDLLDNDNNNDSSDIASVENEEEDDRSSDNEERRQLDREIGSGIFNRNERYDVKKPGPFFPNSENNFFLNKLLNSREEENNDDYVLLPSEDDNSATSSADNKQQDQGQMEYENPILAPVKDKRDVFYNPITRDVFVRENDDNYVHIGLKKRINTWQQGSDFIQALAQHFNLPDAALSDRKIENQHVQFRVDPNPQNIDAKKMADELSNDSTMQNKLKEILGVEVDKALSGNKEDSSQIRIESVSSSPGLLGFQLMILLVVLTSTIAALFVTGLILCLARKKARRNAENKLNNFQDDTAGKNKVQEEYKDLCRGWSLSLSKEGNKEDSSSNTKNNGQNKKPSSPSSSSAAGAAASGSSNTESKTTPPSSSVVAKKQLSKESEGSNRSSTSSWSEDPSNTNMDISTGHMVLAYMEDHLKNKQRLEQEWVGLCGYEAEPCSTTVAFKSENKKKNRYPDKLPYDHNRVILNALLNSNNSDYINASTVTDHDPRNPSYIVTQGPLAQTVPDFWQMIWEQGCVVIVMLSRLQDQEYTLCHRYWPEEGSEQYHIFEVHLVSEHVWCDDYLVRSVYLKNTRTGETRTVTQFHFRSWPAHGIPTSTKALLEFRRKVNKSYRGRSCPIAVHCSDGVGRSGTYVLIDMVLNRMSKGCKEIDIAATLEHIRDQRGGMVQNRSQFEFCLMAVAEEVHAILKALPQ